MIGTVRWLPILVTLAAVSAQPPFSPWSDPKALYAIPGLPQQEFYFDAAYANGKLIPLQFEGTVGFILKPNGKVDPQRRWVWISPMWLALRAPTSPNDISHRYYVESFLEAGFHVVGLDVGTTCGSPAGAALYQRFYESVLIGTYNLNSRARMIGQSNGGLISYAWAFRHPRQVARIFGIFPVTDMRSWPGLLKVVGEEPLRITPDGLRYPVDSVDELESRLAEFNPVDNVAPLVKAGIQIFHLHGDKDALVPLEPNSAEFVRRYRALGGHADLEILPGLPHGGKVFYQSERAVKFLLE